MTGLKDLLEFLGGARDERPAAVPRWLDSGLWWGLWWATLALIALAFSGQTSQFIYIDF